MELTNKAITFLGDSITEGHGVEKEEIISKLAEIDYIYDEELKKFK